MQDKKSQDGHFSHLAFELPDFGSCKRCKRKCHDSMTFLTKIVIGDTSDGEIGFYIKKKKHWRRIEQGFVEYK